MMSVPLKKKLSATSQQLEKRPFLVHLHMDALRVNTDCYNFSLAAFTEYLLENINVIVVFRTLYNARIK